MIMVVIVSYKFYNLNVKNRLRSTMMLLICLPTTTKCLGNRIFNKYNKHKTKK